MTGAPYLVLLPDVGGDRWSPPSRIRNLPAESSEVMLLAVMDVPAVPVDGADAVSVTGAAPATSVPRRTEAIPPTVAAQSSAPSRRCLSGRRADVRRVLLSWVDRISTLS